MEKFADILVNYSTKIKEGDRVQIYLRGVSGESLALATYKKALQAGAISVSLHVIPEEMDSIFYEYATDAQLNYFPHIELKEMEDTDVFIGIAAEENPRRLMEANPRKIATRDKVLEPIFRHRIEKTRWVVTRFPTAGYAQNAGMSTDAFTEFLFDAVNQDWSVQEREQEKIKQYLDKAREIRLVADRTDLTVRKDERPVVKCFGEKNMPDGEVFFSPLEDSAAGKVSFSFPVIYQGNEIDGVELELEKGVIVGAKARLNEQFLLKALDTDEGAERLGEFGIGTNYNIERFVKNMLFDEKIGGTVHIAPGASFPEAKGVNRSGLHLDMLVDLRKGGELYADGVLIQENGRFTGPLEGLFEF